MFVASLEATSGSKTKKKNKTRVSGSVIKNILEKLSSEEMLMIFFFYIYYVKVWF